MAPDHETDKPLVVVGPVLTDLWREIIWRPNACSGQLHGTGERERETVCLRVCVCVCVCVFVSECECESMRV